jgi:sulfate adenylyltransferase
MSAAVTGSRTAEAAPQPSRVHAPSWTVSVIERADLELLAEGGYAPLTGFMTREQVAEVGAAGRLPDGTPWPAPIILTVDPATAAAAEAIGRLDLADADGTLLGSVVVSSVWREGDGDGRDVPHVGGDVEVVRPLRPDDVLDLRRPLAEVRREAAEGGQPVVAAQPCGFVDARTAARWSRATSAVGGRLLIAPAIGADPEHLHHARIRGYRALLAYLPSGTLLRLIPSGRDPSARDAALLHAAVARNAGATHLLVDDHLDVAAVEALGLTPVDLARFADPADPPMGAFHEAVATEHRSAHPPRSSRGLVIMFTGLSGSGKSTVAKALTARLAEHGDRRVTLLDGDLVRQHLSSELGFSREHRDLNVRRIGYVASEIAKHGGAAVCAPIAPYDRTRREVRDLVANVGGGFVLVHVATPLATCEARDVKGLYARARAGELTGFTGIDDPYEAPTDAEVVVDTSEGGPTASVAAVLDHLVAAGWLAP